MAMDFDINDIDFNNMGSWPLAGKAAAIAVVCSILAGVWIYFDTVGQLEEHDNLVRKEGNLKSEFKTKQAKAAVLDAYKAQMAEMEESFGTMLRQLPSEKEVANLVVDITQTGLASGLTFDLIEPKPEVPQEFYAERPYSIKVKGGYHDLGEFVSGIAALPRIVTLHDIHITTPKAKDADTSLVMQATAKTYRYLNDEEIAVNRKADKKKRRR